MNHLVSPLLLSLRVALVRGLDTNDAPRAQWLFEALKFYVEFHREHEGLEGCVVNDVLPIAALLQPDVLTFQPARITVDLDSGDARGRTREAPDGVAALVAREVRVDAVRALLSARVFRWATAELPVEASA